MATEDGMSHGSISPDTPIEDLFELGSEGHLIFMGVRYPFRVIGNEDGFLHVSLIPADLPLQGVGVTLELRSEGERLHFETFAVENTLDPGEGVILRWPRASARSHRRLSWRIPGDFRVQLKDHVHPRWHECPVIDLGAGGLLVRTQAQLKAGDNVDLLLTFPESTEPGTAVGQVKHVMPVENPHEPVSLAGIKLVDMAPDTEELFARYIRNRLREIRDNAG